MARRFFWTLRAKSLTPREQAEAEGLLQEAERPLFWAQPTADQRHGLEGARRMLRERPGERAVARAALLHDVGKRHCGLGLWGRSLASGLTLIGIRPRMFRSYYDHGRIGADELEAVAAEDIVVGWSRFHTEKKRPESISVADWGSLIDADRA